MRQNYKGIRFFKCDLQMGTPIDSAHWMAEACGNEPDKIAASAELFVRKCYENKLEVIAITDHNFASLNFIPILKNKALEMAPRASKALRIFPGFEITANVGKGVHCLAIFESDTPPAEIDHILTECGVPYPRVRNGQARPSTKSLFEIIAIVQRKDARTGRMRGIVICPHSQAEAGIFDGDRISEWLQACEFTNPDLYCVEVPKPVSEMSEGWQRLFASGDRCDPNYRRDRPIACIMSSDAKAYSSLDGVPNYIGSRSTWIKMSNPSIESLRQAFLDHSSRVRLGKSSPNELYTHPKIQHLGISGAKFLANIDLEFSPNLTCIIGGRGTGKSTIVEYLRMALGQSNSITGRESRSNFDSLLSSTDVQTSLCVTVNIDTQSWTFCTNGRDAPICVSGENITDVTKFFPARILSQREIYAVAESASGRASLVDDMVRSDLNVLDREEARLIAEIETINSELHGLAALLERRDALLSERSAIRARLTALESAVGPLATHSALAAEVARIDGTKDSLLAAARAVQNAALPDPSLATWRASARLSAAVPDVGPKLVDAVRVLRDSISQSVEQFVREVEEIFAVESLKRIADLHGSSTRDMEEVKRQLREDGLSPELYDDYVNQTKELERQLAEMEREVSHLQSRRQQRDGDEGFVMQLGKTWEKQTAARVEGAVRIESALPRTEIGTPLLTIDVVPFGDQEAFARRLREELKDKRRIAEDDWEEMATAVCVQAQAVGANPVKILEEWVDCYTRGRRPVGSPWEVSDRKVSALLQWISSEKLLELAVFRVPDLVNVRLYRKQDGTLVGELGSARLSVGQRCTAVLAILLAADDVPIVIDQPEDDLDNEFVYTELVPVLRHSKERRQIILVTHNANIPVNGDAELIVALGVRSGRGAILEIDKEEAIGGLDKVAVKLAVEQIMEGTEEAFRWRFDKYGY